MKRYPKIVQFDSRGQIVIPKDIRQELGVDEGSGFYMFTIKDEGILLKKIPDAKLDKDDDTFIILADKAKKLGINKKNLKKTVNNYKKNGNGKLEEI